MGRTPFIVGNWKMYKTAAAAAELCDHLCSGIRVAGDREVGVAPPFPFLSMVRQKLENSRIRIGAQNLHPQSEGAYTGEVSGEMLFSVGCSFVIIGHSERREYFSESDSFLSAKVQAAFRARLDPILCVGERLQEREAGVTETIVRAQLAGALAALTLPQASRIIIAYEPVWAIGTGKTATPEMAQQVHGSIRQYFGERCGQDNADRLRILYGGSVKPDNVDGLMAQPDIDGALVGGASLDAGHFSRIVDFRS